MIVNQKEASHIWCPMDENGLQCVGPDCMAWRWFTPLTPDRIDCSLLYAANMEQPDRAQYNVPESWVWEVDEDEAFCAWREPGYEALKRRPGYCGFAGKPDFE